VRVLLVDDYEDSLEAWAFYLTAQQYDVTTATRGDRAIEIIERDRPDVVVSDLQLPGLHGLDLARRVRANDATRDIRLIAFTGRSGGEAEAEARLAGYDAVVVKPCQPDELLAQIRQARS